MIAEALIAVAAGIRDARASDGMVIVAGSSPHALHRLAGPDAVRLARHSPVPLACLHDQPPAPPPRTEAATGG